MKKVKKRQIATLVNIVLLPLAIASVVATIVSVTGKEWIREVDAQDFVDIITTLLGIWSTMLGFILTAGSLLIGYSGSKRTQEIMRSRHYQSVLFAYLITCLNILADLVIFVPVIITKIYKPLYFNVMVGSLVLTVIDVLMCLLFLFLMMYSDLKGRQEEQA